MPTIPSTTDAPWPHWLAVLLVCATFPLICIGGLVTSYEAGMAVPDWPSTYGYNLFLYPWQTWLFGPFDIFVEHGHRLLGAVVGLITIALVVATWRFESTRTVRSVALAALALVIVQGILGGLRVMLDARDLAKLHGCTAPLFFAVTVVLATMTSRRWVGNEAPTTSPTSGSLHRLGLITAGLAYLQIVFGAQLRHLTPGLDTSVFQTVLMFHIFVAFMVLLHILLLFKKTWRDHRSEPWLTRPAIALVGLVVMQLALGASTWVVNYGWPVWFRQYGWAQEFIVQQESMRQALVTTAHVAFGSLIFVVSVLFVVRSFRLLQAPSLKTQARPVALGVAL